MFSTFAKILLIVTVALASLVAALGSTTTRDSRPNILFLLTDDQDVLLDGTKHMPRLQRLLTEQGTTFSNFFVHTPICCPSRGSILTGRYLHNIPMTSNQLDGNCYGKEWQENAERETFAVFAKKANYSTGFAGKYMNRYGTPDSEADNGCTTGAESACRRVPLGWDHWMGLVGNSAYYDYDVVLADAPGGDVIAKSHGMSYKKDYFPEVIARRTMHSMREFAKQDAPFLIMVSWPTPHGPFTPAPRDEGTFAGFKAPRTPNFNATQEQNAKKHWLMRQQSPITDILAHRIDRAFQSRQEALQTIDRHVARFVNELRRLGKLDNTIIIYTSDNGYQLGQHRMPGDKRQLYEHDIRVPMIVRGPGVPQNLTVEDIVLNIDIAPTIVDLARASDSPLPMMDGRSFMPLLRNASTTTSALPSWRSDFLVSYHGEGSPISGLHERSRNKFAGKNPNDALNNSYHCVRTIYKPSSRNSSDLSNTMYCEFDDDESFIEYYDLTIDPWQLNNRADKLSLDELSTLAARLTELKACGGQNCRDGA